MLIRSTDKNIPLRKPTGRRIGRRGSYILEAAITLPLFLTAMIVLVSIIRFYACIEDANFILATELRKGAVEAIALTSEPVLPFAVGNRIERENPIVSYSRLMEYDYRTEYEGIDEVIRIKLRIGMTANNPMGLASWADYDASLMTRAYVGRIRSVPPMGRDGFLDGDSRIVYVFPQDGERYHRKSCTFVQAASTSAPLTDAIRQRYSSCPVCDSMHAEIGDRIYYFPEYGESYHLPGCAVLERNYIGLDRDTAMQRGYTACSKCGG